MLIFVSISLLLLAPMLIILLVARRQIHAAQLEQLVKEKTLALESELRERSKAEQELRLSQRILNEAQKIAHFGSWEWDMRTSKVTWSDELFRIYGLPPQKFEEISEALLARVHPDDRERVKKIISHSFDSLIPMEFYNRIQRPDGTVRILHVKGDIHRDKGRPVRVYGACQDVTELKDAEESLARMAAIIASSDDAIIGQTVNGTIASWNKGAERIFGYRAHDIVGSSILKLVPPELSGEGPEILAGIKRGDRIEHRETERVRKDGSRIHVSLSQYVVKNESSVISGASTIVRDITEQKRAQDLIQKQATELEQANQRLMELDKLKSEFVSNVSHELRTPIAAVKGAAANMLFGFLGEVTEEQKESLDIIRRNVDRLARLIENLLDLSRIESGAFNLDAKLMDLRVPVKWAVNGIAALAREKGLALDLRMPEEPVMGRFDEDRTVQILTNLIGNALRFARNTIRITLDSPAYDSDDSAHGELHVTIAVEDDGAGIPEDEISMIFERFHQVRKHMGRHGTGLGLSIVQGIVNAHGGRIWAENRPASEGTGARFTVVLPLTNILAPDPERSMLLS